MPKLYAALEHALVLETRHSGTMVLSSLSENVKEMDVLLPAYSDNITFEFLITKLYQRMHVRSVESRAIVYAPHTLRGSQLSCDQLGAYLKLVGKADQWFAVSNVNWNWA